jgi:hypothetical protein
VPNVDAVPRRVARALDLLNFSLADVRGDPGPHLSIFLLLTTVGKLGAPSARAT